MLEAPCTESTVGTEGGDFLELILFTSDQNFLEFLEESAAANLERLIYFSLLLSLRTSNFNFDRVRFLI